MAIEDIITLGMSGNAVGYVLTLGLDVGTAPVFVAPGFATATEELLTGSAVADGQLCFAEVSDQLLPQPMVEEYVLAAAACQDALLNGAIGDDYQV